MSEIEVTLTRNDLRILVDNGQLAIPLEEGIIDADPSLKLKYEGKE